jgi:hypothetical protein
MPTPFVRLSLLLPLFSFLPNSVVLSRAPAKIHVTLATLHAAELTAPRAANDLADEPYFIVSIRGPRTKTGTIHLPLTGHLTIHRDQALGARPLVDLSLQPGDSVKLLVSVLASKTVHRSNEGAHWLGSANLLLTNDNGTLYWRSLECVATCKLLKGGAAMALGAAGAKPVAGVVELSGSGGTYHMQLEAQRAP